jgi:kumamolisin
MADERRELPGSYRPVATGARRTGTANPADQLDVTVTLRGPELPADAVTGPPMDPGAYASAYGADSDDAARVSSGLQRFGLDVHAVSLAGRSMPVRGSVSQFEAAFGAQLAVYENADQGEFRGREGRLSLPEDIDGLVTGVFGLDERRVARRSTTTPNAAATALTPADFETRYQFPPGDGAGQSIAIAEFGGAYFPDDVRAFCQKYGRAIPAVTPVPVGYSLLTVQQIEKLPRARQQEVLEESVEVMMDVEIVAALCPAASISVYFAPFTQKGWIDLLNAVQAAPASVPVALSISWGLAEDSQNWSQSALQEINLRLQAAAMLGITVCVASGDDGAGDQVQDGKAHVNFPATSPNELTGTATAGEVAWWDTPGDRSVQGGGSTGGGVSTIFPRPAWQAVHVTSINAGSIDGRVVPDVAALAGEPFYDLIFLGQDSPNGGTSAATPLWAALLARIAGAASSPVQSRFLTPQLYASTSGGLPVGAVGCSDVTSGDNRSPGISAGYEAGPGYDAVSGWGTPIGTKLAELLL